MVDPSELEPETVGLKVRTREISIRERVADLARRLARDTATYSPAEPRGPINLKCPVGLGRLEHETRFELATLTLARRKRGKQ
jgi:hypothetical protein